MKKMEVAIQEMRQELFVQGIILKDEDLVELSKYQKKILSQNEWVEFDSQKILLIIDAYIKSGYVYPDTYIEIIQMGIRDYYWIRKLFDLFTTDEKILEALRVTFKEEYLLGNYSVERVIRSLRMDGAKLRKERWNGLCSM